MSRRLLIGAASVGAGLLTVAVIIVVVLIATTSSPQVLPLPRAPSFPPSNGPTAGLNGQVTAMIAADPSNVTARVDLAYENSAHPGKTDAGCSKSGEWSLMVNQRDVIGHPDVTQASIDDWAAAARAINIAHSLCSVPIIVSWVGHNEKLPRTDSWTTELPASTMADITGDALRRYTLLHARQV